MGIIGWIITIHLIELVAIALYLLIRKNNKLEKIVTTQQEYINAVSIVINNSDELVKELDSKGVFQADDEVGEFFRNIKQIQDILNKFNGNS